MTESYENILASAKELKINLSGVEKEKNASMFEHLLDGTGVSHLPDALWKAVKCSPRRFSLSGSREARLQAVLAAYALWWAMRGSGVFLPRHIEVIRQLAGRDCPRSADFIDLVLCLVNDYSVLADDSSIAVDARALSRDAQAVRYLVRLGVRPWEVQEWRKTHPGGLDLWHRLMAQENAKRSDAELERYLEDQAEELPDDYEPDDAISCVGAPSDIPRNAVTITGLEIDPGEVVMLEVLGVDEEPGHRVARIGCFPHDALPSRARRRREELLSPLWDVLVPYKKPPPN